MWLTYKGKPIVRVVFPRDLEGSDPLDYPDKGDNGYAYVWPGPTAPPRGTWVQTENGSAAVVIGQHTKSLQPRRMLAGVWPQGNP